jgi:hypothetical protein
MHGKERAYTKDYLEVIYLFFFGVKYAHTITYSNLQIVMQTYSIIIYALTMIVILI